MAPGSNVGRRSLLPFSVLASVKLLIMFALRLVRISQQRCASTKAALAKQAEIQLLQDVPKVGIRGQQVKVSKGFARNYLVPQRLAKLVASNKTAAAATQTLSQSELDLQEDRLFFSRKLSQIRLIMKRHYPDAEKLDAPQSPVEALNIAAKLRQHFDLRVQPQHITVPEGKLVTPGWYKIGVKMPEYDVQSEISIKLVKR